MDRHKVINVKSLHHIQGVHNPFSAIPLSWWLCQFEYNQPSLLLSDSDQGYCLEHILHQVNFSWDQTQQILMVSGSVAMRMAVLANECVWYDISYGVHSVSTLLFMNL